MKSDEGRWFQTRMGATRKTTTPPPPKGAHSFFRPVVDTACGDHFSDATKREQAVRTRERADEECECASGSHPSRPPTAFHCANLFYRRCLTRDAQCCRHRPKLLSLLLPLWHANWLVFALGWLFLAERGKQCGWRTSPQIERNCARLKKE